MSIGDSNRWEEFKASFRLLDAFYEAGGKFIDTSNNDQDQRSVGDWACEHGIRNQLVIATKYSSNYMQGEARVRQKGLYVGNSVKSMHISVEASLRRLRTSYIDVLYLHWWEWDTSIPEVMNGLHVLVQQGKANQYARDFGKTPFVVYQGVWNVLDRSLEREIIPMCRYQGIAIAPWNVLVAGKLRTDEEERRAQSGEEGRVASEPDWRRNENERATSAALEKVAKEVGAKQIAAVAIAYVMQKAPYVFPVVGGRKVEHLQADLQALEIALTPEHIKYLESALPFDPGFPSTWIGDGSDYNFMMKAGGYLKKQPTVQAIRPDIS